MKMIEQAGGSAFKSQKKGNQGLGITTDHYGNLIQINRKGVRFNQLAQPDTEIRLIAMERAKEQLAQAARLRLENESQSTIVDRYQEVARGEEKDGLNSAAASSSGDFMNSQLALKKL